MACKHQFIGDAEGVKCSLCGKRMTQEEYRNYLVNGETEAEVKAEKPKAAAKPKTTTRKKKAE